MKNTLATTAAVAALSGVLLVLSLGLAAVRIGAIHSANRAHRMKNSRMNAPAAPRGYRRARNSDCPQSPCAKAPARRSSA